jgi:CRP-like cAMP-binding protein|tara:strand:+ start:436 stop:726 length:291 start_codon:yes stop_codon:yes gene_type:complete
MQKRKIKRNYKIIKDMDIGNYFGEIGAISNLRRTSSVLALNSMLIGKIKISVFRDFMSKNSNFQRKIKRKVQTYRDQNMRMIQNMIRISSIFGQFA